MSAPIPRGEFEAELSGLLNEESSDSWWTLWSKRTAFENKERVEAGSRKVEIGSWQSEQREFTIERGQSTVARIATFYYPYWKAEVNKHSVEIECADDGTILIPLPTEKAVVKLYFQEPFLLQLGALTSVIAWITIIVSFICTAFLTFPLSKKHVT
jgi:uncharacterized membrane protein YfhO